MEQARGVGKLGPEGRRLKDEDDVFLRVYGDLKRQGSRLGIDLDPERGYLRLTMDGAASGPKLAEVFRNLEEQGVVEGWRAVGPAEDPRERPPVTVAGPVGVARRREAVEALHRMGLPLGRSRELVRGLRLLALSRPEAAQLNAHAAHKGRTYAVSAARALGHEVMIARALGEVVHVPEEGAWPWWQEVDASGESVGRRPPGDA